jgi:CBS domain-containing protein
MLDHHIQQVPIVLDGKLVGVVTRPDVLKTMAPGDQAIERICA